MQLSDAVFDNKYTLANVAEAGSDLSWFIEKELKIDCAGVRILVIPNTPIKLTNIERLRYLMAKHGLTGKHVARMIHRCHGTVSQYMCGGRPISTKLLDILEEKCNELNQ